jgi:hypothetical protein
VGQCAEALRSAVERIAVAPWRIAAERIAVAPWRIAAERPFDGAQSSAVPTMAAAVTTPAPAIPPTNIVEAAAIMVAAFIAAGPPSIAAARLPEAEQYEEEALVLLTTAADAAADADADARILGRCAFPCVCRQRAAFQENPRGGRGELRFSPAANQNSMRVERRPWLGLIAAAAAMTSANAPASAASLTRSSSALPIQYIRECYFTQSSTGGFTIEQCRRFIAWQFYNVPLRHRLWEYGRR